MEYVSESEDSKNNKRKTSLLREIPQVDRLVHEEAFHALLESYGEVGLTRLLKESLKQLRRDVLEGKVSDAQELTLQALAARVEATAAYEARVLIHPVINGSGIPLHTNLGRAPLSDKTMLRVKACASLYSNLEYQLDNGRRGSRYDALEQLIQELTGAEAAFVVNNNAAAVFLMLSALARGREVLVSRGEAVEIGGKFRIPDVMQESGAILHEVGTTNKTRLDDYRQAFNEEVAAVLKVHRSNFRLEGFTESAPLGHLASFAHGHKVPLLYDLGSGLLYPQGKNYFPDEPTVMEGVAADADVITFSGDKLLGGPQAGIIIGKKAWIEKMKRHPLTRALRCDKMTIIALQETLEVYRDPSRVASDIPLYAILSTPLEVLEKRAETLVTKLKEAGITAVVRRMEAEVGGGSAPAHYIPSYGIALDGKQVLLVHLEKALRLGQPPVIAYIQNSELCLNLRTIPEEQLEVVFQAIVDAVEAVRRSLTENPGGTL